MHIVYLRACVCVRVCVDTGGVAISAVVGTRAQELPLVVPSQRRLCHVAHRARRKQPAAEG